MDKTIELPVVTIVTVVYNSENEIEETIKSIVNQTYNNIEYIIIDGVSTDKTVDIIKKYENKITYFKSEPDNGIYDAMNKAIDLATGKWINFMNAGDNFASKNVLTEVFTDVNLIDIDVLYGNNYYKGDNFYNKQIAMDLSELYKGMRFNHQSTFVKMEVMKKFKYDLTWKIQCEYDLFLKLYMKNYKFKHINEFIAVYSDGGFSEQNTVERTIERWLINLRHNIIQNDVLINKYYISLLESHIELFRKEKKEIQSKLKFRNKQLDERQIKIESQKKYIEKLEQKHTSFKIIKNTMEELCKISFLKKPLKKVKQYKKLISTYHEVKKG